MQVLWSFWSGFSESKWCDYFLLTNTNTKLLKEEGKKKEKKKNQNKACTQKSRAALPSQFKTKPWNLSEGRRVGEKQIPNIEDCKAVLVLAGGVHFPSTNTALKARFPQYEEDLLWVFICNIEKAQNTAQQVLSIMPARRDHHPSAASKAQGICSTRCSVGGHWYISLKEKLKERQSDPKKKEHQPVLSLPVSFVQWDS